MVVCTVRTASLSNASELGWNNLVSKVIFCARWAPINRCGSTLYRHGASERGTTSIQRSALRGRFVTL